MCGKQTPRCTSAPQAAPSRMAFGCADAAGCGLPCSEAVRAEPAPGHHALRQLLDAGRLHRHYTLNIDGLAEEVGMATWHHEHNTGGVTVEMHGNVRHLVCPECYATQPMTAALAKRVGAVRGRGREPGRAVRRSWCTWGGGHVCLGAGTAHCNSATSSLPAPAWSAAWRGHMLCSPLAGSLPPAAALRSRPRRRCRAGTPGAATAPCASRS